VGITEIKSVSPDLFLNIMVSPGDLPINLSEKFLGSAFVKEVV
jgi:hypothetical protein